MIYFESDLFWRWIIVSSNDFKRFFFWGHTIGDYNGHLKGIFLMFLFIKICVTKVDVVVKSNIWLKLTNCWLFSVCKKSYTKWFRTIKSKNVCPNLESLLGLQNFRILGIIGVPNHIHITYFFHVSQIIIAIIFYR